MAQFGDKADKEQAAAKEVRAPVHVSQFHAKEAMNYVDGYRNAIRKQAQILKDELEVKQKRLWEKDEVSPQFYAELRALEDGLRHVLKGEDPDWVILGDPAKASEETCDPVELVRCQQELMASNAERQRQEEQYKELLTKAQELQALNVRQRQEYTLLRRRLEQNNSTFMVVVATMFLVILVQIYLIWTI